MQGHTTYPTIATVNHASMITLHEWDKALSAPQTDVERTVRRKITARLFEMAGQEVRQQAPGIAERFNDISAAYEKICGIKQPRM